MTPSEHAQSLGRVVSNLLALETWIRHALLQHSPNRNRPTKLSIKTLAIGSVVPIHELTNYKTLGALLKEFNLLQRRLGREIIDEDEIVKLRDALAHGRVVAESDEVFPVRLIKFSAENRADSTVTVTYSEVLDEDWFDEQLFLTKQAIRVAIDTAGLICNVFTLGTDR